MLDVCNSHCAASRSMQNPADRLVECVRFQSPINVLLEVLVDPNYPFQGSKRVLDLRPHDLTVGLQSANLLGQCISRFSPLVATSPTEGGNAPEMESTSF